MNSFGRMRFAIFFFATIAVTSAAAEAGASGDVFTPVITSTLSPETHAVRGTDNVYHIIYELQLTNTRPLVIGAPLAGTASIKRVCAAFPFVVKTSCLNLVNRTGSGWLGIKRASVLLRRLLAR